MKPVRFEFISLFSARWLRRRAENNEIANSESRFPAPESLTIKIRIQIFISLFSRKILTMKKLLFAMLLSSFPLISFAQNSDSLELGKTNKEFYIRGDQTYKASEYKKVFTNADALKYAKRSRSSSTLGQIFGFTGGALMGAGIVKALQKDETVYFNYGYGTSIPYTYKRNQGGWALAGIGAGVTLIGIIINSSSKKNLNKAVELENGSRRNSNHAYYKAGFTGHGMAFSYHF